MQGNEFICRLCAEYAGAHSQGKTLEELQIHMKEVLELILEEKIEPESEFIGTQVIQVG